MLEQKINSRLADEALLESDGGEIMERVSSPVLSVPATVVSEPVVVVVTAQGGLFH